MFRPQPNRFVSLRNRRRIAPLVVEHLEDRITPVSSTFVVDSLIDENDGDYSEGRLSLREAVIRSNVSLDANTILFAPELTANGPANFNLSIVGDNTFGPSALLITSPISIEGPTGANGVTIRRNALVAVNRLRLFYVAPMGQLTLQDLTLSDGVARGYTSAGAGGGSAGLGGAVVNAGTLTLTRATLNQNEALGGIGGPGISGGGGGLGGDGTSDNRGSGDGGGPNGGISLNEAGGFGGGGSAGFGGQGQGGFGGGGGGGSASSGSNGGFGGGGGGGNSGGSGAAGGFGGGDGDRPGGGGGAGLGGAVFNHGGTITVNNSTLAGNKASFGFGGGSGTSGKGYGGAIFNLNGNVNIFNSTLARNVASDGGGAVYNFGSDFEGTQSGPAINFNNSAVATFDNSILSGSIDGSIAAVTDYAAFGNQSSTGTNNIVELNDTIDGFTGTGTIAADPLLAALGLNGGPTQTFALNFGSPAIDAATAGSSTDQRGIARPQGAANDIGSYELMITSPPPPTNTPPTITDITDKSSTGAAVGPIGFTIDDAQTLPANLILSAVSSNEAVLRSANIVFGGNGANRTVTVTPVAEQFGTATITVTVTDANNSTATDTFNFVVSNTPPTITDITNQTSTGAAVGPITFTIGDAQTPANNLTVTAKSSNGTLVPTGNIVFGGSGANRTVTVTPVAEQFGTATITVTVTDGNNEFATDTFIVFVNSPPTILGLVNRSTTLGTAIPSTTFTVGDLETLPGSLTVDAMSSTNSELVPLTVDNIIIGGSGTNRTVTIIPAAGKFGTTTITLRVRDADGASTTSTFTVFVNSPPTILGLVNRSTTLGTAIPSTTFTVGDRETPVGSLTVSKSSSNLALVPLSGIVIGGSGASRTVTVVPVAEQFGTATITLTVTDGNGATTTSTFTVFVNSPPTITSITNKSSLVNDGQTTAIGPIEFTISDFQTPLRSLTVAKSSSNITLVPVANIVLSGNVGLRRVTITPVADEFGTTTITLTVMDGNGATATSTFQLTVARNTPPVISSIANLTINRGAAIPPISFTVGDAETLPANLRLSSEVSGLGITSSAPTSIGAFGTLTITNPTGNFGTATITIIVTDANGATARTSFVLTITRQPNPTVIVGNRTATLVAPFTGVRTSIPIPFGDFAGSVRAAVGDINGDGIPDVGFAAGPTGGPRVAVVSGKDGSILLNRFALEESFRGGVDIAIGDLNGDGFADLVVGAGYTGGPRVVVISGKDGSTLRDFFAYEGTFRGGVNVGLVDFDGDGKLDIVTGAGTPNLNASKDKLSGAPLVRVFRYADLVDFARFFAGNINDRGGVSVSGGDFGTDAGITLGRSIVTGTGIGIAPPRLSIFRAADYNPAITNPTPAKSYPVFESTFEGGFTIGVADINGDSKQDILVGAGPGGGPRLIQLQAATGVVISDGFEDNINFLGGIAVS